jgi:hypothetical protein
MAESGRTATRRRGANEAPAPRAWWQWLLMYPALALGMLSGLPTVAELVESYRLGVPFGESRQAMMENKLWRENTSCASAPFSGLVNPFNFEVDAVVCRSGNVLVRVRPPDANRPTIYRWVPLDSLGPTRTADAAPTGATPADAAIARLLAGLLPAAAAAEPEGRGADGADDRDRDRALIVAQAGPGVQVICQRWLRPGMLLRRVAGGARGCFDETVNTYTGRVERVAPAPCVAQC